MNLEGNRIQLRYMVDSDIDHVLKWENDEQFWDISENESPYERSDIENFVKQGNDIHRFHQLRLIICEKEEDRPLGCIDIFDYNQRHQRAGLGVLIYSNSDRRKGFAREALEISIKYLKEKLRLKQVYCHILEHNKISIKLFESLGFEPVGFAPSWQKTRAGWIGRHHYQLILN